MKELISYPDGIHALESGYGRSLLAAIHIVVDEDVPRSSIPAATTPCPAC